MLHLKSQIQDYFSPRKVLSVKYLSQGFIGDVFIVEVQEKNRIEKYVMKSLKSDEFTFSQPHDQWHNFASSYYAAKNMRHHAKIIDIVGLDKEGLHSALPKEQYFQVLEFVDGKPYAQDLERIRKEGTLTSEDKEKAKIIARSIAELHQKPIQISEENKKAAYLRATRDMVMHSELALTLFDTYEKHNHWFKDEFEKFFVEAIRLREKRKHNWKRLAYVHGDFWFPNMMFKEKEFITLDASRFPFGDPGIDVGIHAFSSYFQKALMQEGNYSGPFNDLGKIFVAEYIKQTGDTHIAEYMPLYLSAILPIIIRPGVYDISEDKHKKIFQTSLSALREGKMNWKNMNAHLE